MKNKKGFTLIELVTVFAILAVLGGVSVPLVFTYLQTSRIMQYNDYAKTIYLSAQSYLTNERGAGQLSEFDTLSVPEGKKVESGMVLDPYYSGDDTYYLIQNKGDVNTVLRAMLEQYISDPFIMDQSICVEYNPKTGSIYSVSYSEVAEGFFYSVGTDREGKRVSISDRSEKKRKELEFGYYSAQLLEAPPDLTPLDPSTVNLINEEQLYLKWSDAMPSGARVAHDLTYTVKLRDSAAGASAAPLVSIEVNAKDVKLKALAGIDMLKKFLLECETTTYNEDGSSSVSPQLHWIYRAGNEFFLVLDSIDTSANSGVAPTRGIAAAYPNIGSRKLRASVSAVGEGCRPNQETLSNMEHSLFANQTEKNTQVSQARHLFNLRYDEADLQVTQLKTLDWRQPLKDGMMVYNGEIVKASDVENSDGTIKSGAISAAFGTTTYVKSGASVEPFSGSYEGGGRTISGLYLTSRRAGDGTPTGETGLFAQNAGTIKNINLEKLTLRDGTDSVGAVAGANQATGVLENIHVKSVLNSLELTAKGDNIGGIAGKNEGKIQKCSTDSTVFGRSNVGGIVGLNAVGGEVINCETTGGGVTGGSEADRSEAVGNDNINVGGIIGKNEGKIEKCNAKGEVLGHSNIGGIVGLNTGVGTVANCDTAGGSVTGERVGESGYSEHIGGIIGKNEATVTASLFGYINVADVTGDRFVGGIIGSNDSGTIIDCTNSGFIWAKVEYGGGITGSNGTADGKFGRIINCVSLNDTKLTQEELEERATGDFIGGITGYNNGSVEGKSSQSPAKISGDVMGVNYVGGVIGHNDTKGKVSFCEVTGGSVVATGDFAGGFFGLNTSLDSVDFGRGIELRSNPKLVKGRHFVGGSIGANLVSVGKGGSTLTISSINGRQGEGRRVEAQAFAGGVLGYGGVVSAAGDSDAALKAALEVLRNIDPETYDPEDATDTSSVETVISNSQNYLDVTANRYVGGIIGLNSAASKLTITKCGNGGTLSVDTPDNRSDAQEGASYYIGGITGRNSQSGLIEECVNNGKIISLSKYTGGIAEVNNGKIINCNNAGIVTSSKDWVGGIVGLNGETNPDAEVIGCKALVTSEVRGRAYLGGLVGENAGVIKGCSFAGLVEGKNSGGVDANFVGGIVGMSKDGGSLLDNETLKGSRVTGHNYIGGIVGKNESAITMDGITNLANVTGNNFVGGIVG